MPAKKVNKLDITIRAYQVFRVQGYAGTSMKDISTKCGIFKSGLYYYFSSKEALACEVLKTIHNVFSNEIFPILKDETLGLDERLETFFDKAEFYLNGDGGCIFSNLGLELSNQDFEMIPERLEAYFREFVQSFTLFYGGQYDKKTATALAVQTVQDIEGSILMSRVFANDTFYRNAVNRILSYLEDAEV